VERRSDYGHFGSVDWRACVRIKVSGHLCIKCPCDSVGWRVDLAKVASWWRLGLGRAEGVSVAGGGPRARRKSSGVGCPCPRLGSGEAWSCPSNGSILDLIAPIRPLQLCADGGYQLRFRSLEVTPNYGPRQSPPATRTSSWPSGPLLHPRPPHRSSLTAGKPLRPFLPQWPLFY
jgi:hypothetical protein